MKRPREVSLLDRARLALAAAAVLLPFGSSLAAGASARGWNAATLDKWLANPQSVVPGNPMTFPGIRDAGARADVIEYLHAVSQGKAPTAAAGGGMGGMMGGSGPINLKTQDPSSQVTSLHHCGDA